ncbi:hypothetical protein [Amycolatopsis alkalitolerans]|uniref:Uncharacterized protein n=1 Tax=Amycolatopsis alkalitolerans TaxID=2547244 RepID=A0A5C4M0Y7_9PSEU|nr:hypothetical protein [Amycolatopsis alkalitolerans]TNC24365.1 hypothetical protein FG385_18250 [Amycolatopsis alkalitolerans]
MSVEGAGPGQGAETATAATADTVVPEGRGDVRGISDLTYRILTPYLSHTLVHRVMRIVLITLTVICLVATGVRLSPLPLLPIPLFGFGYYCLRRVRAAGDDDRTLLVWFSLLMAGLLVGFWILSVAGNHVG